ncbi:GNAT family N-acetyltransferase [Herpetosiphon giganteus]|uniref:GNAT family N-acetyltransferase n=1 Tax=Herpetosiphon giganteus TaxID=2029754 RepID=UPI00195AB3AF|nr:GNAT family N-acetyltransferase [Herpetosiphon giganteus]MBM7843588.1 ribosomal protein S18 acetylase RimI-like enzyme [Herpetosiphon giganteus]
MPTINRMQPDQIDQAAAFMAQFQHEPSTHLGFAGAQADQIAQTWRELEFPIEQQFALASADDQLQGLIGLEQISDTGRAFLWGPIALGDQRFELADSLLAELLPELKPHVTMIDIFCNLQNQFVRDWAARQQFYQRNTHAILAYKRSQLTDHATKSDVEALPAELHAAFCELHDQLFPQTYYSGSQILERINQDRQVFIMRDGEQLLGYIYTERQPEFAEAGIEFVGVAPIARGRGIATKIMQHCLTWIFSAPEIQELELVVDQDNPTARGLYEKVGFRLSHEMVSLRRDVVAQ